MLWESSEISGPKSSKVQVGVFAYYFSSESVVGHVCSHQPLLFLHFLRLPSSLLRNLLMCGSFGFLICFCSIYREEIGWLCSLKSYWFGQYGIVFLKKKASGFVTLTWFTFGGEHNRMSSAPSFSASPSSLPLSQVLGDGLHMHLI